MTYYHCDGSCDLVYDNGDSEQSVDLHTVEWCYQELIIWEGFISIIYSANITFGSNFCLAVAL